jgi:hypothetical protein
LSMVRGEKVEEKGLFKRYSKIASQNKRFG